LKKSPKHARVLKLPTTARNDMSRLTQARAGIPSAKQRGTKGANPRKRTTWFVGNIAVRNRHNWLTPLSRDWRDGEPLIVVRRIYGEK